MKLRFLPAALLEIVGSGLLSGADPQLVNLVMPDAKVLAGINVDQAKASLFGQYLITQIQAQDQHLQQLVSQTGFDPTQNLDELLLASNAMQPHTGLTLARGTFKMAQIATAAQNAGAVSELYKGVMIIENPQRTNGFAFLSSTYALAGDVGSVKGAIDRQTSPAPLPASLQLQLNNLSANQDAWLISEVPPPATGGLKVNGGNLPAIPTNTFQSIQQATAGVKLGSQIAISAELTADNAQDATTLAGVLQFLVNMGALQTQQKNPQASTVLQSATIAANGYLVDVSLSIPEAAAESLFSLKPKVRTPAPNPGRRRPQ